MKKIQPSNASILVSELAQTGRTPESLTSADLLPHYAKIRSVKCRADIMASQKILPATPQPNIPASPLGVIVETRRHRNLPFVVNQICEVLGIPVQIFHGRDNRNFILRSKVGKRVRDGSVILTELQTVNLSARLYNGLFLNPNFWNRIIGRGNILVFQTDTVVCVNSRYRLKDFADFDYIGPSWQGGHTNGLVSYGGIGGFTLRDWNISSRCLQLFPADIWPAGEDRYFAFHIELAGGTVASNDDSDKFCTQHNYKYASLGAHKLNGLSVWDTLRFMAYCPAAWRVLTKSASKRKPSNRPSGKLV